MKDMDKRRYRGAFLFITLMGIVALFSDMTHEGARSILGAFLNETGATAATVGFVSGFGELLGYGLRIVSGRLADRSRRYWTFIIAGYTIQVLAIPALALAGEGGWILACTLVVLERVGKAIKKPAKNTLVSFASSEIGVGKGFAYQEFLDQLGAFLGPVMLFFIGFVRGGGSAMATYRLSFLALGIPAAITIVLVLWAKVRYPHPDVFEKENEKAAPLASESAFKYYLAAIALFAFGFIDFPLITLHVADKALFSTHSLSLLYALAMIVDAIAALVFGWLYDRIGIKSLIASSLLSSFFALFIFSSATPMGIIFGIVLWGIGMGAQESVMKAAVSGFVSKESRSTGFGIVETIFGVFWFFGSWLLSALYADHLVGMIFVSVLCQLLAVAFYLLSLKKTPLKASC